MQTPIQGLTPFLLERWFAEFEFLPGMRQLAESSSFAPTTAEVLSLGDPSATDRYLALGLGYIENPGGEGLRRAVAALHHNLVPEQIRITTGASEAILLVLWALLEPGDNIIVEYPCYQSHEEVARALGAEVRRLPLRPENSWKPDPEQLAQLIDRHTRFVLVNHPHNPTGATLTQDELATLIAVTEQGGAMLVSDEVFRLITLDGSPPPSAADLSEKAIAIGDLSKPWGLAGLRVGWCTSRSPDILRRVSELRDYTTMCCSGPSEYLAELALLHSDTLLAPRLQNAKINLQALASMVERAKGTIRWQQPSGGYSAFLRLPEGVSAEPFCRSLALEEKVLLLPGTVFGPEFAAYVRLGYGGAPAIFDAGLQAVEAKICQSIF